MMEFVPGKTFRRCASPLMITNLALLGQRPQPTARDGAMDLRNSIFVTRRPRRDARLGPGER